MKAIVLVAAIGILVFFPRLSEGFFQFDFDDIFSGFEPKKNIDESYYQLFGLTRDTFEESALKKAYRSLLKKYHPDHNDDPDAAEKFGEITHAYEVLSDPEKKRLYDLHGKDGVKMSGNDDAGHQSSGFPFDMYRFVVILTRRFFNSHSGRNNRDTHKAPTAVIEIPLTLEEIYSGTEKIFSFARYSLCKTCKGSGAYSASDVVQCPKCRGSGQQIITQVIGPFIQQVQTKCSDCNGSGKKIQRFCSTCKGSKVFKDTSPLKVQIPAGVENGHVITLEGAGDAGADGRYIPGDIQCKIKELPHRIFRRGKKDPSKLSMDLSISLRDSLLGWTASITGVSGNPVVIERKDKLTPPGSVIEIPNGGLPKGPGALSKKGSLFVSILVKYPLEISDSEKTVIKKNELFNKISSRPEEIPAKDRAMYPIHDDL